MVVSYIGQWKIPFAGRKAMPGPGGLIIRRPFWLRCTVRPSIPVRNEAQTPPGTAVSQAPATESLITLARCFPVPVSRRSKLRFEPIHTESAGPAVMAGPGPGNRGGSGASLIDRTRVMVAGSICQMTGDDEALGIP